MKKIKKIVFFVVTLLLLYGVASIGLEASKTKNDIVDNEHSAIKIIRTGASNSPVYSVKSEKTSLKRDMIIATDNPIADSPVDEIHPNIAKGGGLYFVGYTHSESIFDKKIITLLSTDGVTWDPFIEISSDDILDYSAYDYWDGSRFCGTFGSTVAYQYLLDAHDVTDPDADIDLFSWDWSDNGWSDFQEFDIACHNSQNEWEYGVMSTVATTDYPDWEVVDGPHMFFRSPDDENTGYISWNTYPGCAHSASSIDRTMDMMYNAYDYLNDTSWNILLWKRSFEDPFEGVSEFIEIETSYDAEIPTIAAENDEVIIVAESNENGNKDLVCYYSTDGGLNFGTSYVTNTPEDEMSADIVMLGGGVAAVIFAKDKDLYVSSTEDSGETWSAPIKVNQDSSGTVIEEFRAADTCTGSAVWTDEKNGNMDIYFAELPTAAPQIEIDSVNGGVGITAVVKNTGNAPATDVTWSIDLTGNLVFLGGHAEGTIANLNPDQSVEVKSGFPLGFGDITIDVAAGGATETKTGKLILFFITGLE